jgi:hypothetical protein
MEMYKIDEMLARYNKTITLAPKFVIRTTRPSVKKIKLMKKKY